MLINISILDHLSQKDLEGDKLIIDLNGLSSQILEKCPLLLGENSTRKRNINQSVQDIRLHLLYLINRRQSQILASVQQKSNNKQDGSKSPASMQIMSSAQYGRRKSTVFSQPKQQRPLSTRDSRFTPSDVYSWILHKPQLSLFEMVETFLDQFNDHLVEFQEREGIYIKGDCDMKHVDIYYDGLYGDKSERVESMIKIRQLARNGDNLISLSENRLLICALLRSLNDSLPNIFGTDQFLCESILFCFIKFTMYIDIYEVAFKHQTNVETSNLIKTELMLLSNHVKLMIQMSKELLKLPLDKVYHSTNALLLILANLIDIDENGSIQQQILSKDSLIQLYLSLVGLMQLISKQLARDLKISTKSYQLEHSLTLTRCMLWILKKFCVFREFINEIRGSNRQQSSNKTKQINPLLDTLIGLIGTLQLSRPGSGQAPSGSEPPPALLSDQHAMNQFYELELMGLEVINRLLLDRRLKNRLIKRNLLKCVLRNLVSFLAHRSREYPFASFHRSSALMVPLLSLYELTCESLVKSELFKSRIVMRCMMEYLLTDSLRLKQTFDIVIKSTKSDRDRIDQGQSMNEVKLEPSCVSHYILSIWCNLSTKFESNIHSNNEDFQRLLMEYMNLAVELVLSFSYIELENRRSMLDMADQLTVYLHLKLLRNFTQLMAMDSSQVTNDILERLLLAASQLRRSVAYLTPMMVDILAVISNMLRNIKLEEITLIESLRKLVAGLFTAEAFETENDNDDLLLVSIVFLSNLARIQEICSPNQSNALDKDNDDDGHGHGYTNYYRRMIREGNFILESKTSDEVMVLGCLYAISQLMRHRGYLKALLKDSIQANELMNQLSYLMLSYDANIAKLACHLANMLRQLELAVMKKNTDQREQVTRNYDVSGNFYLRRFVGYNGKWLDEIRSSRDEVMSPEQDNSDDIIQMVDGESSIHSTDMDLVEDAADLGAQASGKLSRISGETETTVDELLDEDEEDSMEDFENQGDSTSLANFDLNVIDSNSMIKHLISRCDNRSKWN